MPVLKRKLIIDEKKTAKVGDTEEDFFDEEFTSEEKVSKITKSFSESKRPEKLPTKVDVNKLVPTGSTTFNLECSGRIEGAFSIGRMVNIIGDSSAGKCIKNAYIISENGMQKIDTIGEELNLGISAYSHDLATSKNVEDITSHFWKEEVNKTIKISSNHGYSLEGTEKHPIMVFTKDFKFEMKKLQDVEVGDCCVIARGTNKFSKTYSEIPKVVLPDSNGKAITANVPKVLNPEFARFLGYIVADGNLSKNQVHISNKKKYVQDDLKIICESLGVNFNGRGVSSQHLQMVVSSIFGNPDEFTARNKFVPDCILQSPKDIQVNFLRALIDCDSWSNNRQISYSTASATLAEQVHLMLLNLGIIASKQSQDGAYIGEKYYDHTYWEVTIYGKDLNIYSEEIGSLKYNIPKKGENRKSDFDTVHNLVFKMKEDLDALRKKLGWSPNGTCKNYSGRFPRFKFRNVLNGSTKMIQEFIDTFKPFDIDLSLYQMILESGYHFDHVRSKEEIEGKTLVYDVHIPKTHLFWSNGFVSHNTLFCLTIFAECSILKRFDNYRFIFDDVEAADEFDIAALFGKKLANRIDKTTRSRTIEDLNDNLARELRKSEPFIYVVDSFDALTSEASIEKDDENRKKREKGQEVKGSYGDGKPKTASEMFSKRIQELDDHDSLLIIISQTRDNIGFGSLFNPKTRSGGKALKFYASHEVWLACQEKEKEGKRTIVTNVQAKITKNKLTGRQGETYFPILFDYGIDNISSCIRFMVEEGGWGFAKAEKADKTEKGKNKPKVKEKAADKAKKLIDTKGFVDEPMVLRTLIKKIEDDNLEQELYENCQVAYDNLMESLKPKRKSKY